MTIGFIADLHIWQYPEWGGPVEAGLNRRAREQVEVLSRALKKAEELDVSRVYILGDVFDRSKPDPQLLTAVRNVMVESGVEVVILVGNHDQVSSTRGDHALGPLEWPGAVRVVDIPELFVEQGLSVLCIPFIHGDFTEGLEEILSGVKQHIDVIAFHAGVSDATTPKFMQGVPDCIHVDDLRRLCASRGISAAFCGNWHEPKVWDNGFLVCQAGTLIPHSFADEGFRGRLVTYEKHIGMREYIVEGPVFATVTYRGHTEWPPGTQYLRVRVEDHKDMEAAMFDIKGYIKDGSLNGARPQLVEAQTDVDVEKVIASVSLAQRKDTKLRAYIKKRGYKSAEQIVEYCCEKLGWSVK
jgi:hypothetical protein